MNPLIAGTDTRHSGTALSVNINKVALLRNTRHLNLPDVCRAALLCLQAGADGITVHPRPDGRHIRTDDIPGLVALLKQWPEAEFNIEGNPFQNLMDLVREHRPHQCTFVPDGEGQFTSDHGWDLATDGERLRPLIDEAHALGVRVSLFMDADPAQMALARSVGADRVELYTEPYAAAYAGGVEAELKQSIATFAAAATSAQAHGLSINAGHDLNRSNLGVFLAGVPGVLEVSIGHALIADALELGLSDTVRDYLRITRAAGTVPDVGSAADAAPPKSALDWSRAGAGPRR